MSHTTTEIESLPHDCLAQIAGGKGPPPSQPPPTTTARHRVLRERVARALGRLTSQDIGFY